MPNKKNKLLETASLLRIFGFRISGQNSRNRTRDGSNNDGQICDTQIGYLRNPDALRLKCAVTEEIRGEKTTTELTYGREVSRHRPKPGNAGTDTDDDSNNAPDTGKKTARCARSARLETGAQRPRKRIVLQTRELWGQTRIMAYKKKEATRTQVMGRGTERNSRRLQATNLKPDTDSRKIKIRTKGRRKEICERKINHSAEKQCYVLTYSLVKCSERSNLKTARKNRLRSKLRHAPQAPLFGYEQETSRKSKEISGQISRNNINEIPDK